MTEHEEQGLDRAAVPAAAPARRPRSERIVAAVLVGAMIVVALALVAAFVMTVIRATGQPFAQQGPGQSASVALEAQAPIARGGAALSP